jgi:hypothetical protein
LKITKRMGVAPFRNANPSNLEDSRSSGRLPSGGSGRLPSGGSARSPAAGSGRPRPSAPALEPHLQKELDLRVQVKLQQQ